MKSKEFAAWNEKQQQGYCSVGYAIRQHKVSGSVIRNSYLLIKIGSKRIKILIFNSGRLQISRHISFVGSNQLYIRRISFVMIKKS